MNEGPLHLFEAFGVEIEYMIVDARTLDVRPITDRVFQAVAGQIVSDVEVGEITWSNELTAHVIELKTTEPARSLAPLPAEFNASVRRINSHPRAAGGPALALRHAPLDGPAPRDGDLAARLQLRLRGV